jgi:AraC-like DNA-binding protein
MRQVFFAPGMTDPTAAFATLDTALRAALVALMLFLGAVVWRDHRRTVPGRLMAALALGIAAYALQSSPGFGGWPVALRLPLALLSTGNAVVFWLFARAVFDDDFRPRPWHALAWAALAGAALAYRAPAWRPALDVFITAATAGFALLAVAQTVASWRADLIEGRRRLRIFIVAAGALYTLVNMGVRVLPSSVASVWQGPVELVVLAGIVAAAAWRLVGVAGEVLEAPVPVAEPPPPVLEEAAPPDPAEVALLDRLDRLMREERVYREEGLTIAVLAHRLDVPEYRLRRTINQRLGARNFNAFLNGFRLAEVRQALADPARAGEAVLALALEAGFQSLGPFNRAFKAETGLTPTEFRKAQRGG